MNLPYDNAKDAVEFWQRVTEIFDITLEYDAAEESIHPGDYMVQMSGLWYGLEEFTRDMLARCVLWLAAEGAWVQPYPPNNLKPRYFGWIHDLDRTSGMRQISDSLCVFTAHRDAVLTISGDGSE